MLTCASVRSYEARNMRDLTIDLEHVLGISPARAKAGTFPCSEDFINAKKLHLERIVLVRVSLLHSVACSYCSQTYHDACKQPVVFRNLLHIVCQAV
jgi:hypothetical protein